MPVLLSGGASKRPRLFRPGKLYRDCKGTALQRGPGYFARERRICSFLGVCTKKLLQRGPGYFARERRTVCIGYAGGTASFKEAQAISPGKAAREFRGRVRLAGELQRGPGYFARESRFHSNRDTAIGLTLQRGPGYFARESSTHLQEPLWRTQLQRGPGYFARERSHHAFPAG